MKTAKNLGYYLYTDGVITTLKSFVAYKSREVTAIAATCPLPQHLIFAFLPDLISCLAPPSWPAKVFPWVLLIESPLAIPQSRPGDGPAPRLGLQFCLHHIAPGRGH